jgi:hypothetical protein
MKQAEPFGCQIGTELSNACEIAARAVEASNETRPDWIEAADEDNGDDYCRGLCRLSAREVGKGHDHRHRKRRRASIAAANSDATAGLPAPRRGDHEATVNRFSSPISRTDSPTAITQITKGGC